MMRKKIVIVVALTILCTILYLPGVTSLPPFDRDESRYAQASKQMLETGDFINIRFQETPRHKKPVGIYWLQSLSVKTFDTTQSFHISYFRLPSIICSFLAVIALFLLSEPILGAIKSFLAATILASTLSTIAEAHLATTDAALLLSSVVTMIPLIRTFGSSTVHCSPCLLNALLFWIGLALGILIKGPVLPAIVTLAAISHSAHTRSIAWILRLRPWIGVPILTIIVMPWLKAIQEQTKGGFISNSFQGDILPKLIGIHESHAGFPGYYALTALISFWPWTFLLVPTVVSMLRQWREPTHYGWTLWLAPAWIALELTPTKLPHYSLPLFPALAVLASQELLTASKNLKDTRFGGISVKAWSLIGLALALICTIAPIYFAQSLSWKAAIAITLLSIACALPLAPKFKASPLNLTTSAIFQATVLALLLFGSTLNNLGPFWASSALTSEINQQRTALATEFPESKLPIASAGFSEPSLVFLNGTATLLTNGAGAAKFLQEHCPALALVSDKELPSFNSTLQSLGVSNTTPITKRVFNYSKGKWQTVYIHKGGACAPKDY